VHSIIVTPFHRFNDTARTGPSKRARRMLSLRVATFIIRHFIRHFSTMHALFIDIKRNAELTNDAVSWRNNITDMILHRDINGN